MSYKFDFDFGLGRDSIERNPNLSDFRAGMLVVLRTRETSRIFVRGQNYYG